MIEIVTGVEDDNYVLIAISNGFKPIGKQKNWDVMHKVCCLLYVPIIYIEKC